MNDNDKLEKEILDFGKRIFGQIKAQRRWQLNRRNLSAQMMNISMRFPETKSNLFRLVDVLPSLKSSKAISEHINQYLFEENSSLPNWLKFALKTSPGSVSGYLAAQVNKIAIKEMAKIFIAGENSKKALPTLAKILRNRQVFTVDLLGEYSLSEAEARNYQERYLEAINTLNQNHTKLDKLISTNPIASTHRLANNQLSVSVKLSALYSQISILNKENSVKQLTSRLSTILENNTANKISFYLDAEDSGYNPIILETFKKVFGSKQFAHIPFPGIVVQAYSKSAEKIISELLEFASKRPAPIAVRLVKGAYWDHETVLANQNHWENPLFTKKSDSDANFEKLSRTLLENHEICLPAFASHNIRSLAHACCYAASKNIDKSQFELQMLYGMADPIANTFTKEDYLVRLYVPLGEMLPGMGYLVRRLLENTSNESFLKHTFYDDKEVSQLLLKPQFSE